MGKRDMKNKTPPSGAKSQSLVLRLNTRLFFRQLGIFLCMDLLLVVLALMGQLMWAEKRCADVAQLVQERGVPTAEAVPWMAASDYTIIPLDREPKGVDVGELGWFSGGEATADGLRTYVLFSYYTVELPNGGEPYAITVDLSGIGRMLKWAGFILLTVQIISLIANLFRNAGTIRRTLRPIQELAARINEIADGVQHNADSAVLSSQVAGQVGDSLKECSKQMEEALEAIRAIRRNSDEINSIVSEIEDIAFRTNILSLNASVEAARAGEAGRGFAVVASEVRRLAAKASDAAKMTAGLVEKNQGIAIVTDSNSGITQEEGRRLGVSVIPMPFLLMRKCTWRELP